MQALLKFHPPLALFKNYWAFPLVNLKSHGSKGAKAKESNCNLRLPLLNLSLI
jgi:hypothetical protein